MSKRQVKKKQTKEKIMREALELFKADGFKETSVDRITQKAEIAKGTFFNYFPTKEAILVELQRERNDSAQSFLHSAHVHSLPFIQQMSQLIRYLISYYDVDPAITKHAFLTVPREDRVEDSTIEELPLSLFETVVLRGQTRGELKQELPTSVIAECCYGLFLSSLYTARSTITKEQFLAQLMQKLRFTYEGFSIQKGSQSMKQNIVILGGGYGGLRIVQRLLALELPSDVQLTLVDRMPYHCLKTEYYALAAGTEPDAALRVPFPNDPRLTVKYGEITSIDLSSKQVLMEEQEPLPYDYLVVALGCEDRYHGVPGAEEYTQSIQTINKTRETYRVLNNVQPYGKVAIVGGGLSGVELASELRESRPDLHVQIYDRGESILSPFPERLQKYVRTWFVNHGVDLVHKASITKVEPNLLYNHDEPIEVDAIVWTAGIQANRLVRELPIEQDTMGRAKLTEYHHLPDYPEVFVVGDCASLPHAPSAQLAEAQGDQIAIVLHAKLQDEALPKLSRLKLKGVLGSLGKKHGFGLMGETTLLGRVPRVLKTGVLWMYKHHSG